ncbi:hypothetical protein MUG84_05710 [Paenibacillus sp. KQZ6P-2]|uniref:Uncharacterized protein n=1 Tax=Paenibacillus mangrovi TaxID=2931978 RepID=A0A9X1WLN6_9BACL|nr:hypothetical protein [Paenibacillus mangrovi]MCJ8011243.1 hypothetical protein [Paenibacillus mangrovi]
MSSPPYYGYYMIPSAYVPNYSWVREYPPVQTDTLNQSLQDYYKLMEEGYRILNKLSEHEFAFRVMTAAQAGHRQEVDRLMKSISTTAVIKSGYTPTGIGITVEPKVQNEPCCKLAMFLKWGE